MLSLFSVFWRRLFQHYIMQFIAPKFAPSTSNATTQLAPRRDHWFAVSAWAPQHRSLQQRGLLYVRSGFTPSGLGDSLPLRFVGGLQHHCVILWAVSTLSVSIHRGLRSRRVFFWFVQHRWAFIDSRVSLCRLTSLTEIFASCAERFVSLSHAACFHVF